MEGSPSKRNSTMDGTKSAHSNTGAVIIIIQKLRATPQNVLLVSPFPDRLPDCKANTSTPQIWRRSINLIKPPPAGKASPDRRPQQNVDEEVVACHVTFPLDKDCYYFGGWDRERKGRESDWVEMMRAKND